MTTAAPLHPLPAGPLLVCAATRIELAAFNADERLGLSDNRPFAPAAADDGQAAYLLTGVGTPCTLGRLFALASGPEQATPPFRLVLNIGIAGAYPGRGLAVGDIVVAGEEVFGDIGYETPGAPGFEAFVQSLLGDAFYGRPFALCTAAPEFVVRDAPSGAAYRVHVGLRGATVNTCTGTDATGARRAELTGAAFETMEGAAVAQWGRQTGTPVCEVRAVSNIAARRDMRPENIARALSNLADYLAGTRDQGAESGRR